MFLYFDRQGSLKEKINNSVIRAGDISSNEIYVYCEAVDNLTLNGFSYTFYREDGANSVEYAEYYNDNIEIPYNKKQDLGYFEYYKMSSKRATGAMS